MEDVRSAWEVFEVDVDGVLFDDDDLLVIVERLSEMRIFSTWWFSGDKVVKRRVFAARDEPLEAAGLGGSPT